MTKYVFIFLLIILSSHRSYAQHLTEGQLDSMEVLASRCDTIGLVNMGRLVTHHYYRTGDHQLHRYYMEQEVACAEQMQWYRKQMVAYNHRMVFHLYSGVTDTVLWAADELLNFIAHDTSAYAQSIKVRAIYSKGHYYLDIKDDVEKGFAYYQEARNLALENSSHDLYLFMTHEILNYYRSEKAYQKIFDTADETLQSIPDPNIESNKRLFKSDRIQYVISLRNRVEFQKYISKIQLPDRDSSDFKKAYELGLRQMAIDREQNALPNVLTVLVRMLESLDAYLPLSTLLELGEEAMEMKLNVTQAAPYLYTYHGSNLVKAGRYKEAEPILYKAIELAKEQEGLFELIQQSYDGLVALGMETNNINKAKEAYAKFKIYTDSAYVRKNRTAVEAVETKYILSQTEAENALITEKSLQLSERLKLFTAVGILLLLLALLAFAFYLQKRKSANKLEELMDTKDKIFAILAHDLRDPISSLKNLSEKVKYLIENNRIELLDEMLSQIDRRMESLNGNLNNVLLWAISEVNLIDLKPENINIRNEIEDALTLYEHTIDQKDLQVKNNISEDHTVIMDPRVFKTILRNLISNAIKFSFENGAIEFSTSWETGILKLQVSDNGIGLKGIQKENPENKKLRGENTGSGIGIKICKELASKSDVTLELIPNPKGGTVGIIKIPIAA